MAIAYDSGTNSTMASGTTVTFSHTCSGTDRILFVGAWSRGTDVSGVTYNGVSMTACGTGINIGPDGDRFRMYYLVAPATGTNSVVVTGNSGAALVAGTSVSYTGASQTGQPDGYFTTTGSGSSYTGTITTTADNSWAVMMVRTVTTGTSTAGSGTTRRTNTDGHFQLFDGNGAKTPAGSYSLNATSSSQSYGVVMTSFSPSITSTVNSNFFAFM